MTTKFIDSNICTFKILLSWRFPRKKKTHFRRFSSLPPMPPPLTQNCKFYFYCRLAVSESKRKGQRGHVCRFAL